MPANRPPHAEPVRANAARKGIRKEARGRKELMILDSTGT
jgi:hypothetical protein